jgi:putative ABC transport system permease protein
VERFWKGFLERVQAIPGVESTAATTLLPLRGGGDTYFYIDGRPPITDSDKMNATVCTVTDDYFSTMRIAMVQGRTFNASDAGDGAPVTVINTGLAKRLFPNESAIGKRLVIDFGKPVTAEIVGIAGDVRVYGQVNDAPDIMYFSNRQPGVGFGVGSMHLVARVRGDPNDYAAQMRAALRGLEADVPLATVESMSDIMYDSISAARLRTQLLTGFAVVALVLAVVGLYGMLAYSVMQRSREMGIRIALGAQAGAVFGLVLRKGVMLVVIGIVLGVAGAMATTKLLSAQLFNDAPNDPTVFGGVAMALALAGVAACVVPARRATKADPISALRIE